ncbi:DUF6428 family protein [Oleiharenicola sp. Vm1]|uniref:DUF6428 family protein n=1 Tax=Oleiharenicola sp. Vm1 TaxID=3398393 RepID=UPI0039F4A0E3
MKTSAFLSALRAHVALPVVFRAGAAVIPSSYHLTEVKRVAYETMDCGAMTHRWSETQFELWVPPSPPPSPAAGTCRPGSSSPSSSASKRSCRSTATCPRASSPPSATRPPRSTTLPP